MNRRLLLIPLLTLALLLAACESEGEDTADVPADQDEIQDTVPEEVEDDAAITGDDPVGYEDVVMVVRGATLSDDNVTVEVAFQYDGEEAMTDIPEDRLDINNIRLIDSEGQAHPPVEIDENLENILPEDGFEPGSFTAGNIVFSVPNAEGRAYTLELPPFSPTEFTAG
jgi:hypothetical protein